ncbi:hypothetical protein [Bradyrhizobium sp. Tv2a-2]|uniref:hypothetical protein n=1 Tax=Bradyrhizobium sp. Tv2a-2 TaxID=113395 RepID=UPI0004189C3E|nr:hypothetical protein [Bradyrhizobium sp. Tv2a-2]
MIPNLIPSDWYWAAKDGRIYSSRRDAFVYYADPAFEAGNSSPWPTDATGKQTNAALLAVLQFYGLTSKALK